MFKDLRVVLDQAGYDVDKNQSLIQGWAIDPVTKSPVEIECSIPATINTTYRPDINAIYGVDRDVEYGFFIQFPGSVHELKPMLTFKTDQVEEKFGGLAFDTNFLLRPAGKLYKNLLEQGLLPELKNPIGSIKKLINSARGKSREAREQPLDRFKPWIDLYEESEFTPLTEIDFKDAPSFTVIVTNKADLKNDVAASLKSVRDQLWGEAEIFLATAEDVNRKIKIGDDITLVERESLTEAINDAAKMASGDYLIFLDNGDLLSEHALAEIVNAVNNEGRAPFIYADSDKIDYLGDRYELQFKPDYDEILLRSHNYILQPVVIDRELYNELGGIREGYEGLQNYDLILRATEKAEEIIHIPKILYHWGISNKRVDTGEAYLKEYERGRKILDERFPDDGEHLLSEIDYLYDLKGKRGEKKISVITGVLDGYDDALARKTVETILNSSDYPHIEIIGANIDKEIKDERYKAVKDAESDSIEELYNTLSKEAGGDVLIFLEPGFRAVESAWIDEVNDYLDLEGVGIVGPRFFDDTYRIQQAGVEVRDGRRYDIGRGGYCRANGYNNSLRAPREVFAISRNCLAISKELFEDLGGFNTALSGNESDIDLSIRARERGKKSVVQNNVSALVDGFNDRNSTRVPGLVEIYPEEKLENIYINENLKPGRSASNYLPIGG